MAELDKAAFLSGLEALLAKKGSGRSSMSVKMAQKRLADEAEAAAKAQPVGLTNLIRLRGDGNAVVYVAGLQFAGNGPGMAALSDVKVTPERDRALSMSASMTRALAGHLARHYTEVTVLPLTPAS